MFQPQTHSVVEKLIYLAAVFVIGVAIVAFVMISVVPRFELIFREFGLDIPGPTAALIEISQIVAGLLPAVLILIAMAFLGALVQLVYVIWAFVNAGPSRNRLTIHDFIPFRHRLMFRSESASVLRILGLAVQRNRSISETLRYLADNHPNRVLRLRVNSAIESVNQGSEWTETLRRQRIIARSETAVLQAAERIGNLTWALDEVAESRTRRIEYRSSLILQYLFPAVLLTLGAMVMFIVTSLMLPLTNLIQNVAGQ